MSALRKFIVIICAALLLQGCIPLLIGGAAAAVTVIYIHDQRTTPQKKADNNLQALIEKKLSAPIFQHQAHIIVSVYNNRVLLAGQTPSAELRTEAQRIALTAPGITKLYNQITIEAPNSTLSRVNDNWISTKIRLELMNKSELDSATLQVVTSDGVVYLMGEATPAQAKLAINIIRHISGVQKVVNVLEKTPLAMLT